MPTAQKIKQDFLDDITPDVKLEIYSLHNALIDEAIENILKGNCKIDGRIPQDKDECYISIVYSLVAGQAPLKGLFNKPEMVRSKNINLDLTFRGQHYKYQL